MACVPASSESLESLRRLEREAGERGDRCLALLLTGVELYVRLGREVELLDMMRSHAEQIGESVRGTPTAEELRRLFERTE